MTKLLCLGDSIMWGVTGFDAAHPRANPTIPDKVGQLIGAQTDNRAISATSVAAGQNSMVDMLSKVNFADYDYILIGYGANDWGLQQETISELKNGLEMLASNIDVAGNNPYVLIDLPIESFLHGNVGLDGKNELGVTQNQVCDTFKNFAIEHSYEYYDWRSNEPCTQENRKETMGDGMLHPTNAVQQQMAQRLADYIKQTAGNRPVKPTQPTQPTSPNQPTQPTQPINPGQPTQPTTPIKKQLNIAQLNDVFQIGTNVSGGVNATIGFINSLYARIADAYGILDAQKVDWKINLGNELVRVLRNGVITSLLELNGHINDLIRYCKKRGIMNYETGEYMATIDLGIPRMLITDEDYQTIINDDWKLIQNTLNQLSLYVQEMEE